MGTPKLVIRPGHPDFLDLPWAEPVDSWSHHRLVEVPAGIHRHPVAFVGYDEGIYVIKELPARLARREHDVLISLEQETTRSAVSAGIVQRTWLDPHDEQASAVITKFVAHSFPYRHLIAGAGFGPRRQQMLDALAGLLVELHLAGCYWGDCSLSNVLYRYDAGAIEAIMIDAETSEVHPELSDGQRLMDLETMKVNVAGEMLDVAAMTGSDIDDADVRLGEDVASRYEALWDELTRELVFSRDESYLIRDRISRLNELGFSVDDIELEPTESGSVVKMRTHVGGRTFNSDRLREFTGIEASENQAKVILGDLNYYLAKSGITTQTGKSVGIFKWLTESFEPLEGRISEIWFGDDPIQGYCDFLHHRMTLATKRQSDVGNDDAFASWVEEGFPGFPTPT